MGKFIVIEGIDKSGKSTLSMELKNHLEKAGYKIYLTHEPTSHVDDGLDLMKRVERGEYLILLAMFIRDRLRHNQIIKEKILNGFVVICDRYSLSTLAYQGSYLKALFNDTDKFFSWTENVLSVSHIKPNLTIFIDFNGKDKRDENTFERPFTMFEEDSFLSSVYDIYKGAIEKKIFFEPGIVLKGSLSKEEMLNSTLQQLERII
jgi:dTMP kinase